MIFLRDKYPVLATKYNKKRVKNLEQEIRVSIIWGDKRLEDQG